MSSRSSVPFISEVLREDHILTQFKSGNDALDRWLNDSAGRARLRGAGRTWVWHSGDRIVVAYFTVVAHALRRDSLPKAQGRSLPREIPAILLAKLALDGRLHGQHLGEQLLIDSLSRAAAAGELVGSRYLVVDAIDGSAVDFYTRYGFTTLPGTAPVRLLRRVSAIAADLGMDHE